MTRRGVLVVLAAQVALAALGYAASSSAAATPVADWEMNEGPGSTTMWDSSGFGRSGRIGGLVQTGVWLGGAKGYQWPTQNLDGVRPGRLVTVGSSALNPGYGGFGVTVRVLTGAGNQNILQKGQANTAGGYFKVDMVQGRAFCVFRGSQGFHAIGSSQTLWDRNWHTIRCERRSTGVTIRIDGGSARTNWGATGLIQNTTPLTIGGKLYCSPPQVGCDYFIGNIDRARVDRF